jgi:hypothetical protein
MVVMTASLRTVIDGTAVAPKVTPAAPANRVPLILMLVPPATSPLTGLTAEMTGVTGSAAAWAQEVRAEVAASVAPQFGEGVVPAGLADQVVASPTGTVEKPALTAGVVGISQAFRTYTGANGGIGVLLV